MPNMPQNDHGTGPAPAAKIRNADCASHVPPQNVTWCLGLGRLALPQVAVVQNMPLNDHGTGPAPVGGSHFQPLPTNLAGVGLSGAGSAGAGAAGAGGSGSPQILTGEAALASLGQGGHTAEGSRRQVTGAGQVRLDYSSGAVAKPVAGHAAGRHKLWGSGRQVTSARQLLLIFQTMVSQVA